MTNDRKAGGLLLQIGGENALEPMRFRSTQPTKDQGFVKGNVQAVPLMGPDAMRCGVLEDVGQPEAAVTRQRA